LEKKEASRQNGSHIQSRVVQLQKMVGRDVMDLIYTIQDILAVVFLGLHCDP